MRFGHHLHLYPSLVSNIFWAGCTSRWQTRSGDRCRCYFRLISSKVIIMDFKVSMSCAGFVSLSLCCLISSVRLSSRNLAFLCSSFENASFNCLIFEISPCLRWSVVKFKAPIWCADLIWFTYTIVLKYYLIFKVGELYEFLFIVFELRGAGSKCSETFVDVLCQSHYLH